MKRGFKRKLSNYTTLGDNYKKEFRTQLRMIITFTLGLGIAFTWREFLYEGSKKIMKWVSGTDGTAAFGGAIFITVLSILLIQMTSYWLKERPNRYYRAYK